MTADLSLMVTTATPLLDLLLADLHSTPPGSISSSWTQAELLLLEVEALPEAETEVAALGEAGDDITI